MWKWCGSKDFKAGTQPCRICIYRGAAHFGSYDCLLMDEDTAVTRCPFDQDNAEREPWSMCFSKP